MFLILILLFGCGRPLTENEIDFASKMSGDQIALDRVRLVDGSPAGDITFRRKPRPREACRERILPPVKDEIVTASPAAVALFNKVFLEPDWYVEDYMPEYPDKIFLVEAMLLAHELTHVWQWQNRRLTGYNPLRAAAEHGNSSDPYLFDLEVTPNFLDFGFEQQGAIVEEYVCCRALAPQAKRTRRLHDLLLQVFPVTDLPRKGRESDVYLPWAGAELKGVCA